MTQALRIQCRLCLCAVALDSAALVQLPAVTTQPARPKPAIRQDDCTRAGCHGELLTRKVMHGPVSAGKCLDCHTYLDPGQHRFHPVAEADPQCIRCHDVKHKSVLHKPLRDGRCVDCHDPHGSDHAYSLHAEASADLCRRCHEEQSSPTMTLMHGGAAAAAVSCTSCHEAHSSEHSRLLKQEAVTLCTSCHKNMRPVPGEALSIHAPARDDCVACHDPHATEIKHALKQPAPELCLSCHKNLKDAMARSPVAHLATSKDPTCLSCHTSHFSTLSKLQKERQPQQCLNCHDRTLLTDSGRSIANMAKLLTENQDHHGPIRLGACTACHQPHGSNQPNLLSAAYPPEFYAKFDAEQYQLCFGCHTPELAQVKDASAPTGFKDAERNLHWLHVNQEKGRTCRACHEVHASRQPFHIRESVPFGPSGWAMTLKYRRTASGGTCETGCHGEKSYDHGGRPRTLSVVALTPKGQALVSEAEAKSAHRPTTAPTVGVGGGDYAVAPPPFTPGAFPCTACHDPTVAVNTQRRMLQKPHEEIELRHDEQHRWCLDCHNAQNRDVLRSASGEPIPFAESYRLCGQCHGSQYRDWKTGVHGKRSGEWAGRKEYLLCVHCHDPHSPKFKEMAPLPPPARPRSH